MNGNTIICHHCHHVKLLLPYLLELCYFQTDLYGTIVICHQYYDVEYDYLHVCLYIVMQIFVIIAMVENSATSTALLNNTIICYHCHHMKQLLPYVRTLLPPNMIIWYHSQLSSVLLNTTIIGHHCHHVKPLLPPQHR